MFFGAFFIKKYWETYTFSEILSSTVNNNNININNKTKYFLSSKISIIEIISEESLDTEYWSNL